MDKKFLSLPKLSLFLSKLNENFAKKSIEDRVTNTVVSMSRPENQSIGDVWFIQTPHETVPPDAYKNWNYTLNKTDKTITLNYYKGSETDITVYGCYVIDEIYYDTIISDYNKDNTRYMFKNNKTVKTIAFSKRIDTSNVTNMSCMFSGCTSLTSLDLSTFDTSNVIDMEDMFYRCTSLTSLDLTSFNTSNVTNMSYMFDDCTSLNWIDLSNFDTSNVTDMPCMFSGCSSLTSLDLSNFDTSNVVNMYTMFYNCKQITTIIFGSGFNTSNVTEISYIFKDCTSLTSLDLSTFDTSNVIYMEYMFSGCTSLTSLDLSTFDTSNVIDMSYMFSGCKMLEIIYADETKWDTSKATKTSMFYNCKAKDVTYKE